MSIGPGYIHRGIHERRYKAIHPINVSCQKSVCPEDSKETRMRTVQAGATWVDALSACCRHVDCLCKETPHTARDTI